MGSVLNMANQNKPGTELSPKQNPAVENQNQTKGEYDGRQNHIRGLETPPVEVFENIYADREYTIEIDMPEFTAICPKTGLPDFGVIKIKYKPQAVCLELKSLKEYFLFFRNVGIFHENVVNKTVDDLVKACQPAYLEVMATYNVRGGITTVVKREYTA